MLSSAPVFSIAPVIGFSASPDECEENKQLDHDIKITSRSYFDNPPSPDPPDPPDPLPPPFFHHSYFIKAIDRILPSPSARDLQALLMFFQHPAWFIAPVNP